jgi:hypothetical protein
VLFTLLIFAPHSHAANVPERINYNGRILAEGGVPLETDNYKMSVRIFDAASGGTLLWGPQLFDDDHPSHSGLVPVANGYFGLILGPADHDATPRPLSTAFKTDGDRYLEVQVHLDSGDITIPRERILSTAYALAAADGVAPGTIAFYAGGTVPDGWLVCDGSELDIEEYPELYAALGGADKYWSPVNNAGTFNIPDLRGRFLRGWGSFAGVDPGSRTPTNPANNEYDVGSIQNDNLKRHQHDLGNHTHSDGSLYLQMAFGGVGSVDWIDMRQVSGSFSRDAILSGMLYQHHGRGRQSGGQQYRDPAGQRIRPFHDQVLRRCCSLFGRREIRHER